MLLCRPRLLYPVGHVYGKATAWRMRQPGTLLPVPVICIGNFVAGGAGKTPVALALAGILQSMGERPAFLSRGYGRTVRLPEPIRVSPGHQDAASVGDEPLLLAAVAPTYVSSDRTASGRGALADGATVLLLDDGLQNPAVVKAATMAVVDGAAGVGNGLCLPAGPLRATACGPVASCVRRLRHRRGTGWRGGGRACGPTGSAGLFRVACSRPQGDCRSQRRPALCLRGDRAARKIFCYAG